MLTCHLPAAKPIITPYSAGHCNVDGHQPLLSIPQWMTTASNIGLGTELRVLLEVICALFVLPGGQ
jgi:hypothetical protein